MTIETEDVVAELRQIAELILDGVTLGAGTLGVGRANAARAGADLIQSLSDRIAVLEGERNDIGYHAEQLATYIAQPSIGEKHLASARFHNDKIRASLIKEGSDATG